MKLAEFHGESGEIYQFTVYEIGEDFPEICAVYVFAKAQGTLLRPIYIGQTRNLGQRMQHHHKLGCSLLFGANCICVMKVNENYLELIESDLIAAYLPPCNEQL